MISEKEYKSLGIGAGIEELNKDRRQLNKFFLYMDLISEIKDTKPFINKINSMLKKIERLKKVAVQFQKDIK